jgi:hypothetical protein
MSKDNPNRRLRRARATQASNARQFGSYHTISSPAELAAEIRRQVDRDFEGNLSRAATTVGLPTSTLSRLANGRSTRISNITLRGLHSLLRTDRDRWGSFIYAGDALLRLRDYHVWQVSTSAYLNGKLPVSGFEQRHAAFDHNRLMVDRMRLLNRIAMICPEISSGLLALSRSGQYFVDRIELAALRIIDPLCQRAFSGQVEIHHSELSDDEFRRFVKAGFDRELILLDRESDVARIQTPISVKFDENKEPSGVAKALAALAPEHS